MALTLTLSGVTAAQSAQSYRQRAIELARNKSWDQAIASYHKALDLEPNDPDTHYNLALTLKYKGDAKQADKVNTPLRKGHMALMAYDLAADGSAKFRRTLVDYAPFDGPDGLVCDKDGNLYVAVRAENRPGIYVYSPDGKELAYIPTEVPMMSRS